MICRPFMPHWSATYSMTAPSGALLFWIVAMKRRAGSGEDLSHRPRTLGRAGAVRNPDAFGLRCWSPHALQDRERHPVLMQFGETQKVRFLLPPMPCLDAVRHVLLHTLRSRPLVQPTTG